MKITDLKQSDGAMIMLEPRSILQSFPVSPLAHTVTESTGQYP